MTTHTPDTTSKTASSVDDPERGAAADIPSLEYTIDDILFLLFSFPASFLATFGLTPFIEVPGWGAPLAAGAWANPRSASPFQCILCCRCLFRPTNNAVSSQADWIQQLGFVVQHGAAIALAIRLFRFCWMHRRDVYVWSVGSLGGFMSAHALRLVLRPAFPEDFSLEASFLVPWTYVGTLLIYVAYRLRQRGRLLKR